MPRLPLFFFATTALSAISLHAALAQEMAPPVRDEIIVTAPYERERFDVLLGTSVLSGEELDQELESNIGETLARLPGVESSYFGPGASRPIVRGLGGERIRVLIDGVGGIDASNTSPDHAVIGEPITAERIEVVRGPASLLYGSSAAGGVVNVIDGRIPSAVPEGGVEGDFFGRYGSVAEEWSGAGSLTFGIGEALALHVDGFYRDTDDIEIPGFAISDPLRAELIAEGEDPAEFARDKAPNTDTESYGVTGGASYIFARGFIGLSVSQLDTNYGVPVEEEEEGEEGEAEAGEEEGGIRIDLEQTQVDLKGRYEFGGFVDQAKLRFAYGDYEHRELEGDEVGTTFLNEGWEGRLEFVQRASEERTGAFGLQVRKRDFEAIGAEAFVPPNDTIQFGFFALQERHSDKWHFEASARYEYTDVEATTQAIDRNFHAFSFSGGLSRKFRDGVQLGLQLFRTERAPAAEELFSDGPHLATGAFELGDPALEQEVAWGAETSFKAEGRDFAAAVNLYYNRYNGFIYERATGDEEDGLPVFLFTQNDAEFYGGELEVAYRVFTGPTWTLDTDVTADIVRATDVDNDVPLPRIPAKSLILGAQLSSDHIDFRVAGEFADDQSRTAPNERPTAGYAVLNADVNWHPFGPEREVTLMLQGRNLTDEEVRRHTSFLKDLLPLPGRSIRVAARLGF